jgi:hypothetical protein
MFSVWFMSHPFYGHHFLESDMTDQVQHTVSSQDCSQRMYPSFYSVLLSLSLAAFILGQLLFHSWCVLNKQIFVDSSYFYYVFSVTVAHDVWH